MSWLESESFRVSRGGSWCNDPQLAQVAFRSVLTPGYREDILGLRLMRRAP
jgi:formylglycine-generating enzyme required for sulfatase activity